MFSVKENKIIWSGPIKTTNLDGEQKMTEEVKHVVYKKSIKKGLSANDKIAVSVYFIKEESFNYCWYCCCNVLLV